MPVDTIQTNENGTVSRQPRKKNIELRPREYLKADEVERLIKSTKDSRCGERDALMISVAFNHALRATELVSLEWDQIDLEAGQIRVERVKGSDSGVHYLAAPETRALKALRKDNKTRYVFLAEGRVTPMTIRGFHKIVAQAGVRAKFEFPVHPHMLRHSKGYQLVRRNEDIRLIQGYFGHKSIQHTVVYTKFDPTKLKGFEK